MVEVGAMRRRNIVTRFLDLVLQGAALEMVSTVHPSAMQWGTLKPEHKVSCGVIGVVERIDGNSVWVRLAA